MLPFPPPSPFHHSPPILWFHFVFISNFTRFLSQWFTCSPDRVSCSFGGYHVFCAVLFRIVVHCQVDRHVCTFQCVNQNCRMTFTPAHVCAFLGCSRFLCKCTHVVSILLPPRHPIHSRPQDTLSLGANRPLSLSRLPLSPTLPWSVVFPTHRL